jgi:hypothetical protein
MYSNLGITLSAGLRVSRTVFTFEFAGGITSAITMQQGKC